MDDTVDEQLSVDEVLDRCGGNLSISLGARWLRIRGLQRETNFKEKEI
jgi:hypothetical protein